ncbi:MAG: type II toxin-antitoxin system RelE/ParE family toxin [Acidiferrobacteraceae bacterium]|jgi:phage-related protein|nr:type II toxin-antitoxin system RelE/ParE family toxin [Acidiferrobacteraceae bacterium]MBT4405471.1 type II toxin-antitoxin system RelE/ParE family toxin [Acidiferrobacteraceae bacterium]MBT5981866.1 type II toxin-antitoxin system RelE/ParE family toxin [Acidiferrobacteraceae bacterium]MBT7518170.1 type II toxin-antitoxin system RelE/ParE family toxin [Acidiferrobacteraceae bacterium]
MKKIIFIGNTLNNIKKFSHEAKREAGHQLDRVQRGKEPLDWKPMQGIADGAREIRFRDRNGIYRVIYVAKFEEAVYVLHAFQKKTQKTSQLDIEMAKQAFKSVLEERKL